jgi:hypothetical protein
MQNRLGKTSAGHAGQIINMSALANACDINIQTTKSWLSVLEAHYMKGLLFENMVVAEIMKRRHGIALTGTP